MYIGFDTLQTGFCRLWAIVLYGKGKILALDNLVCALVVALPQYAGILGANVVKVVTLRRYVNRRSVILRVSEQVDERKLHRNTAVKIVVEVAKIFKGSGLVVVPGKLIAYVGKLYAFTENLIRHPAKAVRVHGKVRDRLLRRAGLAVALCPADNRVYLPLIGGGQLVGCPCGLLFYLWQSLLPPCIDLPAALWLNKGYPSGRGALWDG